MRLLTALGLLFIFLVGCSSSKKITSGSGEVRTISVAVPNLEVIRNTPFYSEESVQKILESNLVEQRGNEILVLILENYSNQIYGIEKNEGGELSDLQIQITSFEVKRIPFTLNLTHPGPIFQFRFYYEVIEEGEVLQKGSYKKMVNSASVNSNGRKFFVMNEEDKQNVDFQLNAFEVALRSFYQDSIYELLGVSL